MQTFLTTTTAPPWAFTFLDANGNGIPNFVNATFSLTFRSVSTHLKFVASDAVFSNPNGVTGQVICTLSLTDLAAAYATASTLPGIEKFELWAEATVGSSVYDAVPAPIIQIQKI